MLVFIYFGRIHKIPHPYFTKIFQNYNLSVNRKDEKNRINQISIKL